MAAQHQPTEESRRQVQIMACCGVIQETICKVLDISLPTLHKHYRRELDIATEELNAEIAGTLFRMAKSGRHPAATFFWLKTRAGWREVNDVRVTLSDIPDDKLLSILGASVGAGDGSPGGDS